MRPPVTAAARSLPELSDAIAVYAKFVYWEYIAQVAPLLVVRWMPPLDTTAARQLPVLSEVIPTQSLLPAPVVVKLLP
jgi:hypothetical protein